GLVQIRAKRVFSQDANDQRRLRVGKGFRRPLDKLSEVKQENGLELILRGGLGSAGEFSPPASRTGGRTNQNAATPFRPGPAPRTRQPVLPPGPQGPAAFARRESLPPATE